MLNNDDAIYRRCVDEKAKQTHSRRRNYNCSGKKQFIAPRIFAIPFVVLRRAADIAGRTQLFYVDLQVYSPGH